MLGFAVPGVSENEASICGGSFAVEEHLAIPIGSIVVPFWEYLVGS